MSNPLYINPKPTGYTVEPANSTGPLHTAATQEAAIDWAKKNHPNSTIHVARVRHLTDKNKPDHWRRV